MKKFIFTLIFLGFSYSVFAEVSTNFTLTSDYVWRGQSQSGHNAAIQGGLDYEHKSGFSVGNWVSSLDGSGAEVDIYGAYSHSLTDDFSISLGGTFYHYTKSGTGDSSEVNLGFAFSFLEGSVNYTGDYFGTNSKSWYYTLGGSYEVYQDISISVGLGFTTFDDNIKSGSTDYLDYKVAINRTVEKFEVSLAYTDTNRKSKTSVSEEDTEDHVYSISISRSF